MYIQDFKSLNIRNLKAIFTQLYLCCFLIVVVCYVTCIGTIAKPVSLGLDSVEDGLMFRQCVRDRVVDSSAGNQQILASDEETDIHDLLAGMGSKEKRKMLRYAHWLFYILKLLTLSLVSPPSYLFIFSMTDSHMCPVVNHIILKKAESLRFSLW